MTADAALPFSLTPQSLAVWLDTLAPLPPASAANQLNQALKQLKDCNAKPDQLLPLLINLLPLCMYLSNGLTGLALAEPNHTLTNKSIKIAKLGIQLLRQSALLFCKLAESKQLDATQTQLASYYALQLMGYCLRSYYLLYEMPSTSLWKKSAALYSLAVETGSLEQIQAPKLQEFKAQITILGVLKRNLLFSILAPTRYIAPEINHFFQLANQHFDLLDITTEHARDFSFYWNLEGDEPSPVKRINKRLPQGFMAINCRRFAHALQLGTIQTRLKPGIQAKLALQLSGYKQVFSSILVGQPSTSQLLVGFNLIGNYLRELNKLSKIMHLGGQSSGTKVSLQDMTLIPLEHEKNFETPNPFQKSMLPGKSVNLMRTASKLYAIVESRTLDCNTGDLALLYKQQQQPMLAIIRQQAIHEITGATLVLLEYIPGSCSTYDFETGPGTTSQAIIVGEHGDNPQVFLPNGKYSIDSKIQLNIGRTMHLNACQEYNSYFCRFKISLDL
jgi:hypothetical protein